MSQTTDFTGNEQFQPGDEVVLLDRNDPYCLKWVGLKGRVGTTSLTAFPEMFYLKVGLYERGNDWVWWPPEHLELLSPPSTADDVSPEQSFFGEEA